MHSEWMKVMLEEVERKRDESERSRDESARRAAERAAASRPAVTRKPRSPTTTQD